MKDTYSREKKHTHTHTQIVINKEKGSTTVTAEAKTTHVAAHKKAFWKASSLKWTELGWTVTCWVKKSNVISPQHSVSINSSLDRAQYFCARLFLVISLANLLSTALRSSPSWFSARLWLLLTVHLWTLCKGQCLAPGSVSGVWLIQKSWRLGVGAHSTGWGNESKGIRRWGAAEPLWEPGRRSMVSVSGLQSSQKDKGFQRPRALEPENLGLTLSLLCHWLAMWWGQSWIGSASQFLHL